MKAYEEAASPSSNSQDTVFICHCFKLSTIFIQTEHCNYAVTLFNRVPITCSKELNELRVQMCVFISDSQWDCSLLMLDRKVHRYQTLSGPGIEHTRLTMSMRLQWKEEFTDHWVSSNYYMCIYKCSFTTLLHMSNRNNLSWCTHVYVALYLVWREKHLSLENIQILQCKCLLEFWPTKGHHDTPDCSRVYWPSLNLLFQISLLKPFHRQQPPGNNKPCLRAFPELAYVRNGMGKSDLG